MTAHWVAFVLANLCLTTLAQSSTDVGILSNAATLVNFTHGERGLASLRIQNGPGLPGGFLAGMTYGFVTTPSCIGPYATIDVINPGNATLNVSRLAPGFYHLCFNGVLQTTASPWLNIKAGGGNLETYYWCGNWTAQLQSGLAPLAGRFPLPGYAPLPNADFSDVVSTDSECMLLFLCDFCDVVVSVDGVNVTTYLQPGATTVEESTFALTQTVKLKMFDVVWTVQSSGSGSNVITTTNFTFRLLANVEYVDSQGLVPACTRQTGNLTLTFRFGRDVPGGAAFLLFFPQGTDMSFSAKPEITFGPTNTKWNHAAQSASSSFFIVPLLGNASANSDIPAGTNVTIRFPPGSLTGSYSHTAKISAGVYYPLLLQMDLTQIPVDYAVNPRDTLPGVSTFGKPYISPRVPTMTNISQSLTCNRPWSITFPAYDNLNSSDHFLISLSLNGPMQFDIYGPTGYLPVTSLIGQEAVLYTDNLYQQLVYFNGTRAGCSNVTISWIPNSTFCPPQSPGTLVTYVTIHGLRQGNLIANISTSAVFVAAPTPAPTTLKPTRTERPCPAATDFTRRSSGRKNAPLCEIECNISDIVFEPPVPNTTVLCGLSNPDSVVVSGTTPADSNPPEPDGGVRVTEVVNILMVDPDGNIIPVPQQGKMGFKLPFMDQDDIQKAVWRTKNYKYAFLSCEFYDRNDSLVWSPWGCQLSLGAGPFEGLEAGRKGASCQCTHNTEFAIIVRNVDCSAEYAEWGFGAIYSLCTFFTLIQLLRIAMHPRGNKLQSGNCDILLLHHILLVVVGVIRAVGMFARCSMMPEVRVLLASLPYGILFMQFLLISLVWAAAAVYETPITPLVKMKWMFVVASSITLVFTCIVPGLVVFDINQDERSTVAVFASYAVGGLGCAVCLAVLGAGIRLAWVARARSIALSGKLARLSIAGGVIFVAESALWAITVDEYSLATFEILDMVYRAIDIVAFLLLLIMFMGAVTVRSKVVSSPRKTAKSTELSSQRSVSRG